MYGDWRARKHAVQTWYLAARHIELKRNDFLCICQTIEESLGGATTLSAPQDQVEALIRQVAAENDLEITDKLVDLQPGQSTLAPGASAKSEEHEKEDQLARRCRAVVAAVIRTAEIIETINQLIALRNCTMNSFIDLNAGKVLIFLIC